jgi:hypothetical protein
LALPLGVHPCKPKVKVATFQAIHDTSLMYQENFIRAQQIWIKYKHLAEDIVKGGKE